MGNDQVDRLAGGKLAVRRRQCQRIGSRLAKGRGPAQQSAAQIEGGALRQAGGGVADAIALGVDGCELQGERRTLGGLLVANRGQHRCGVGGAHAQQEGGAGAVVRRQSVVAVVGDGDGHLMVADIGRCRGDRQDRLGIDGARHDGGAGETGDGEGQRLLHRVGGHDLVGDGGVRLCHDIAERCDRRRFVEAGDIDDEGDNAGFRRPVGIGRRCRDQIDGVVAGIAWHRIDADHTGAVAIVDQRNERRQRIAFDVVDQGQGQWASLRVDG